MNIITSHSALSIPLLKEVTIDPQALKTASKIDRLGNLAPRNININTLLSSIAKYAHQTSSNGETSIILENLPRPLLREMAETLRLMVVGRQQVLIDLVPESYLTALQQLLGNDTSGKEVRPLLNQIGPGFTFADNDELTEIINTIGFDISPAEKVVPVAVNPSAWCQSWCQAKGARLDLIHQTFDWVESTSISSNNYRALKASGAKIIPSSKVYRMLRSPKFWAYAVVFIYSSLRALPVMFVKNFHGKLWILWSMDVITAIPYTWGLLAFVTAHKFWVRYTGLLVTLVTFISPYVYFWTHGRSYPTSVNAIVIGMIVLAFLYEARNFLRDRYVAVGLRDNASSPHFKH
ncbi:MAG: hypothetical protein QM234_02130 [Acidobacteriota bacterium]|nr:hypothetical protein [Acidobacteriota bacterium]